MTKKAEPERIAPVDHPTVEHPGVGHVRATTADGDVIDHGIGDHVLLPVEGENGEWHSIGEHDGLYRVTMCRCSFVVIEGKPAEGPPSSQLGIPQDTPTSS